MVARLTSTRFVDPTPLLTIVLFLAATAVNCNRGDCDDLHSLEEIRQQAAGIVEKYKSWTLDRKSYIHQLSDAKSVAEAFDTELPDRDVIDSHSLIKKDDDRFIVNFSQLIYRNRVRISGAFSYDGTISRYRDANHTFNGNRLSLDQYLNVETPPLIPHFAVAPGIFMANYRWLFGYDMRRFPVFDFGSRSDLRRIWEDEFDGYSCWVLESMYEDSLGDRLRTRIWLAKERDLMPIRQVNSRMFGRRGYDAGEFRINSLLQHGEGDDALWFPESSTLCYRSGRGYQCTRSIFKASPAVAPETNFSKLPLYSKTVGTKKSTKASRFIPVSVFDSFASSSNKFAAFQLLPNFRFWGPITFLSLIVLVVVGTPLLRNYTQPGRWISNRVSANTMPIFVLGICCVAATLYLTSRPKGWFDYGLSMMLASSVGFVFIGLTMLWVGKRVFSLRTMLVTAGCAALLFAGYNQGFQKLRSRQLMIDDIRNAGGHVQLISFEMNPDGLSIPSPLDQLVAESWTRQVTSAAIPAEIFDPKHVRRWCLDEGESLTISRQDYQPFDVDRKALGLLSSAPRLWHLEFSRGRLTDQDFETLQTLPVLESLGFDCNSESLPSLLSELTKIRELRLSRPLVDDQFFDILASLPNLENISITQPLFLSKKPVERPNDQENSNIRLVSVNHATLDQNALKTLGQFPSIVQLNECYLAQRKTGKIGMKRTKHLEVNSSVLRDPGPCVVFRHSELERLRSLENQCDRERAGDFFVAVSTTGDSHQIATRQPTRGTSVGSVSVSRFLS